MDQEAHEVELHQKIIHYESDQVDPDSEISVSSTEEDNIMCAPLYMKTALDSNKASRENVIKKTTRVYNKRQACVYCCQFLSKISDHLLRKHADEKDFKKSLKSENNLELRKQFKQNERLGYC